MSKRIVSIGDLVLDILMTVRLPIMPGDHQDPHGRIVGPGGAGTFMIAARHMGLDVIAAGTVGADAFGAAILEPLRAAGVDTSCVVTLPGSSSTVVVVLADPDAGTHTFVGDYGHGPTIPYPPALDAKISTTGAVFVQGYTLTERRLVPLARRAVDRAASARVPVFLDVGPFMRDVPPDEIDWVVSRASTVLLTEDEIPLVSGGRAGQAGAASLLDRGVETVVIKQSERGCAVGTRDGWEYVPGFNVIVRDTVGAGDCFDAAFIAGWLNGLPLWDCGRLANAMGAVSVQRTGAGPNAPTCADVLRLLDDAGERIEYPC